jgi:hypothetical protein
VYVLGNPSIKGHIMQITEVTRIPDTIAQAAPLSSGVLLTVYSDHIADGKCTWQVDYDKVRDYMYVLQVRNYSHTKESRRTGVPLAVLQWPLSNGQFSVPKHFGLNPDYLLNHPKALYPGNPPDHPNRLLFSNKDSVIYPQRRPTPPPPHLIWHETSFIEANWSVFANVLIRYYKRNTDLVRVARIRTKDNGEGFWMQVRACQRNMPEAL